MANSILSRLVGTDNETKEALSSIQASVDKIAETQKSMLSMQERIAKRAAQDKKRDSGDKGILSDILDKNEEGKKKEEGFWSKLFKMLGPLLGSAGAGLLKALGLGGLVKIFTAKFWTDLFGKGLNALFGKNGLFARVWKGAFGEKGWAKAAWKGAFGPKGWARTGWNKAFGKGGWASQAWGKAFGKGGWASKAFGAFGKTGAGKAILKAMAPITAFFAGLGGAGGLGKAISGAFGGIGKKFGNKIVPGLGALIESVSVFKETGDVGQGVAAGGGAFAGGLGGAKLGAAIGTMIAPGIGTAIGGFLGGVGGTIIGSELGQGLYKMVAENPAVIAIGDFFKGYFKGVVDTFKETWESFTGMMSTIGKALTRFNDEVIGPFFKSIGDFFKNAWQSYIDAVRTFTTAITDFIKGTWERFTGAIKSVTDFIGGIFQPVIEGISGFLEDTLGPTLDKIQEFLKPIIDPLKQLATTILEPLVAGFEAVKEALSGFAAMLGFGEDGFQLPEFPSGEEIGSAVSGFFLDPFKNMFDGVNDALSDYANGGEGETPPAPVAPTEKPKPDVLPQLGQETETKPESEQPNRATQAFTLPSLPEVTVPNVTLPEFNKEAVEDAFKKIEARLPSFPMSGDYPQFEFPGSEEMTKDVQSINKSLLLMLRMEAAKNPEAFKNASMMGFQTGGVVPTMLEPGEAVFGPGQWSPALAAMNSAIPRFQSGGIVPGSGTGDIYGPVGLPSGSFVLNRNATSMLGLQKGGEVTEGEGSSTPISQAKASGARSAPISQTPDTNTVETEAEAAAAMEESSKAGSAAIIAAAEKSVGIYKGVSVMCARSTRDVLRLAGHPAADTSTKTGDLDVPVGYAVGGMDLAGSFAGTDMGTHYSDPREAPPGSVLLWRGTYDVAKYGPDAITHVGLKGNGSDMYHHGSTPGWRKDSLSRYMPDLAVDLNGEATGDPASMRSSGRGGGKDGDSKGSTASAGSQLLGTLSGLGEAGAAMAAVFDIFKEAMGPESDSIMNALGLTQATAERVVAEDRAQTEAESGSSSMSSSGGSGFTGKEGASVSDPNARALLNAIADAEGTSKYPNNGYQTMFTGKQFEDMSKHPEKIQRSSGYASDAAGRYQFLSTTWAEMGQKDMSPKSQDNAALKLLSQSGVNIADGLSEKEVYKVGQKWASVEGGPQGQKGGSYGAQAKYSAKEFMSMYEKYGGKIEGKQSGGVVNMKPINNNKFLEANDKFAEKMAKGQQPIVVPVPMGGGGQQPSMVKNPGTQTAPPTLPDGPSSIQSAEYFYRLNMGSVF